MKKSFAILILLIFLAIPCFSEEFTLGMVQQRIHTGMSQSEVLACLGSPNIVTKSIDGLETWAYDKISQTSHETYNKKWFWMLITGRRKGCMKTETSQKTITVVLNFDKDCCLETFMYKTSSF